MTCNLLEDLFAFIIINITIIFKTFTFIEVFVEERITHIYVQ